MAAIMSDLRILIGKVEDTAGDVQAPEAADFDCRCYNIEVAPVIEMDDENAKFATGDHGESESIAGAKSATISFSTRMTYGGTVVTKPLWHKFAESCGCVGVAVSTTGYKLEPLASADGTSMTLVVMDIFRGATPAAIGYTFKGCMGNMIFSCEGIGKPWMANFVFTGCVHSVADVANGDILALTSPQTVSGEKMLLNTVQLGGVANQQISSWALDVGNEISPHIDQVEPSGYEQFCITARRPRLSVNPLQQTIAINDIYGKWAAGTEGVSEIATAAASPHFTLEMPVSQPLTAPMASREGLGNWDINYKQQRNGSVNSDLADECGWGLLQGARAE